MCPRIDQNPEKDAEGARNGAQKSAIACKINEIFASIYQAVGFFSSLLGFLRGARSDFAIKLSDKLNANGGRQVTYLRA